MSPQTVADNATQRTTGPTDDATPAPVARHLRALDEALVSLRLQDPHKLGGWRWSIRQCLTPIRDALINETGYPVDWLQARRTSVLRERNVLLTRIGELGSVVLHDDRIDELAVSLGRLSADIRRHFQRVNDLAYDEVSFELGGSE